MLVWLLLSGQVKPLLLGLGLASALLTVFVALRMEIIDQESHPLSHTPRLLRYWLWLAVQTVKAGLSVSCLILARHPRIDPVIGTVPTGDRSPIGRVIFANSITLTPGTLSLNVHERHVEVYALTPENLSELQSGDMLRRIPDPGAKQA